MKSNQVCAVAHYTVECADVSLLFGEFNKKCFFLKQFTDCRLYTVLSECLFWMLACFYMCFKCKCPSKVAYIYIILADICDKIQYSISIHFNILISGFGNMFVFWIGLTRCMATKKRTQPHQVHTIASKCLNAKWWQWKLIKDAKMAEAPPLESEKKDETNSIKMGEKGSILCIVCYLISFYAYATIKMSTPCALYQIIQIYIYFIHICTVHGTYTIYIFNTS